MKEIDAVTVVTPDHWHALPAIASFEAEKDVFVEKPLSYSVTEGRAMADASLNHKRVTQMGNHIHNTTGDYLYSFRPTPLPGFEHMGHIGCVFEGTEAFLVTNYETNEVWVRGKKVDDFPRPPQTIPDSPGHLREFLLANIAFRTGRRIQWDDERERIAGDSEANRYLARRFRKPWSLKTQGRPVESSARPQIT